MTGRLRQHTECIAMWEEKLLCLVQFRSLFSYTVWCRIELSHFHLLSFKFFIFKSEKWYIFLHFRLFHSICAQCVGLR